MHARSPSPFEPVVLRPVGVVHGGRREAEDDGWDAETCRIELDPERFGAAALAGLHAFSHVLDVQPVLSGFLPRQGVVEPASASEIMAAHW